VGAILAENNANMNRTFQLFAVFRLVGHNIAANKVGY